MLYLTHTALQGIQYLATVTERGGKVYAFFVKSPTKVCPMAVACVVSMCRLAMSKTLEGDRHNGLVYGALMM